MNKFVGLLLLLFMFISCNDSSDLEARLERLESENIKQLQARALASAINASAPTETATPVLTDAEATQVFLKAGMRCGPIPLDNPFVEYRREISCLQEKLTDEMCSLKRDFFRLLQASDSETDWPSNYSYIQYYEDQVKCSVKSSRAYKSAVQRLALIEVPVGTEHQQWYWPVWHDELKSHFSELIRLEKELELNHWPMLKLFADDVYLAKRGVAAGTLNSEALDDARRQHNWYITERYTPVWNELRDAQNAYWEHMYGDKSIFHALY